MDSQRENGRKNKKRDLSGEKSKQNKLTESTTAGYVTTEQFRLLRSPRLQAAEKTVAVEED